MKSFTRSLKIKSPIVREMFAEFLGVLILCVFGNGAVAQSVLSNSANGGFISINWSFAVGLSMAIFVSGNVSGGHVNPAMTFVFALMGRFPWWKVPCYIFAQFLGGFVSAGAVYSVYYEAINAYDGGVRTVIGVNGTAGIFATYPQAFLSNSGGFWDQVVGTALLAGLILALIDGKNNKIADGLTPFLIGFVLLGIGLAYGFNCGFSLNPARDLGPRLFTWAVGYGTGVFSEPNDRYWWWVPVLGPMVGAIFGAFTYQMLIGHHLPSSNKPDSPENEHDSEQPDRTTPL